MLPLRRVTCAAVTLVLCTLAARPCAAEWRRVDSPNFVVVGDVSVGTLRDISLKFEGFRETLSRVLTDRVTGTAVPTVVLVFSSDRAFTPFKPKYQGKAIELGGLFLGRPDINYIALSNSSHDGLRVVFHEYAHLVIANVGRNIPIWLNEGLAEYYSTYEAQTGGRGAVLGRAIVPHLAVLNDTSLLSLDELLKVTEDSPLYNEGTRRSTFYAQSWALTHMLLLGEPRRAPQLGQYLLKLGEGVPAPLAWQQIFGADPIQKDLQRYVRQSTFLAYRYKFPDKLASIEPVAVPLTPADAEAFLADFLIQQDRTDEAIARAAKTGPAAATGPWPATVAAMLDLSKNDYAGAEKRLLSVGPGSDWLTSYRAGVTLADLVKQRGERPTRELLTSAHRLFDEARGTGHDIPNAAARMAVLELDSNDAPPSSLRSEMEQARLIAPGRYDYVFLHARILLRLSEFAAARNMVSPLMSPAYPAEVREPARTLMGYIVNVERAAAAGSRTTDSGGPPLESSNDPAAAQPDVVRPVYRTQEPGEQRLEGVLERIECRSAGAVFHLRSAGGTALFTGRMQDVDFITYRDDFKGAISCGPMKESMRVYVTWRPGTGPDTRVAVAIEVLPK
jgi:hypothetical protein